MTSDLIHLLAKRSNVSENIIEKLINASNDLSKDILNLKHHYEHPNDPMFLGIPNINFSLYDPEGDDRHEQFTKQRLTSGFDDSELWSLRDTIGNFILPRLKAFRKITIGCPIDLKDKEWKKSLSKMIIAFILLTRNNGSFNLKNEKERQKFNEGMDLFRKHFMSLWY